MKLWGNITKLPKIICFWGLIFSAQVFCQYSFELSCLCDTLQVVAPNGFSNFSFRLTNTGSFNDVYELNCQVIESIPGWFETFCVRGVCVEPGIPMFDTLSASQSDTAIHISVYTTSTTGREILSLNVRSLGDPNQRASIRVYTQVGLGIEEIALLTPTQRRGAEIYPNPAKSVIRIHFSSSVDAIRIYDITGKIVKSFSPISQSPTTNHSFIWDGRDQTGQLLPTGSYIVTLTHNGKVIVKKHLVIIK